MVSKKLAVALVAVVVVAGGLAGYLHLRTTQTSGSPSRDIGDAELFISNPPALNQTATLTYIVENLSGITPGMKLSVRIGLQEGLVWLENSILGKRLVWENRYLVENVYFPENENVHGRIEVSGTIKAVKTGRWNITAFTLRCGTENQPFMGDVYPPDYEMMKIRENDNHWYIETYSYGFFPSNFCAQEVVNITVSENSAQMEEGWYWPPENVVYPRTANAGTS